MVQVSKPLVDSSIKITALGNREKNKIKTEVFLQILRAHIVFQNCTISILSGVLEECTVVMEKLQFGLSHTQLC